MNTVDYVVEQLKLQRRYFTIEGGPNKLELANAFFNSTDGRVVHVGFRLLSSKGDPKDMFANVHVTMAQHADVSGNSYNLKGHLRIQSQGRWVTSDEEVTVSYDMRGGKTKGMIYLTELDK